MLRSQKSVGFQPAPSKSCARLCVTSVIRPPAFVVSSQENKRTVLVLTMPRRQPSTAPAQERKVRTREHVIASQSTVHVEKHIASRGYTAERIANDYGYDLNLHTYGPNGEPESGNVYLQLKATDALKVLQDGDTIAYPIEWAHLRLWRDEPMPVVLVVYDAQADAAYWLYLQEACETSPRLQQTPSGGQVTLHLSKANVVNEQAIERFREFKRIVLDQMRGKIKHHG